MGPFVAIKVPVYTSLKSEDFFLFWEETEYVPDRTIKAAIRATKMLFVFIGEMSLGLNVSEPDSHHRARY